MCPLCISTATLIASGALSGGGMLAFVARKFYVRRYARPRNARATM